MESINGFWRKIVLSVAVLGVTGIALAMHVIPSRNALVRAVAEHQRTVSQAEQSCDRVTSAASALALLKAVRDCQSQLRVATASIATLQNLHSQETALQRALSPDTPDLVRANLRLTELDPRGRATADGVSARLLADIKSHEVAFTRAQNHAAIEGVANELQQMLESGFEAIRVAAPMDAAHDVQTVKTRIRLNLIAAADAGASAIRSMENQANTDLLKRIEAADGVQTITTSVQARLAGLKTSKRLLSKLASFGMNESALTDTNKSIESSAARSERLLEIVSRAISAQGQANAQLQTGLSIMDEANVALERLERNAPARVIATVQSSWQRAVTHLASAQATLRPNDVTDAEEETVWRSATKRADAVIGEIHQRATDHLVMIREKYQEAAAEESTLGGSVLRSARRGADAVGAFLGQVMNSAAQSRIGREIGVSAKLLILGTKAFYDLQNPNAEPLAWAMSYSGDVKTVMDEAEQIQRMPGASLTGKNTVIEAAVDAAYRSAFAPASSRSESVVTGAERADRAGPVMRQPANAVAGRSSSVISGEYLTVIAKDRVLRGADAVDSPLAKQSLIVVVSNGDTVEPIPVETDANGAFFLSRKYARWRIWIRGNNRVGIPNRLTDGMTLFRTITNR